MIPSYHGVNRRVTVWGACGDDRPAPVASLTYSAYETYNPGRLKANALSLHLEIGDHLSRT